MRLRADTEPIVMRIITATIVAALGFFIKPNPPPRHELSWPSYSMILLRSDIYECSLERAVRIPEQLCPVSFPTNPSPQSGLSSWFDSRVETGVHPALVSATISLPLPR